MPTKPNALNAIEKYRKKRLAEKQDYSKASATIMSVGAPTMHTGNGPDGIPQPNKPVGMIDTGNGPAMVHEDEKISQTGNGMMITPSPMTMAQPDFEQQKKLADLENQTGMPGYQYGGGLSHAAASGGGHGGPIGGPMINANNQAPVNNNVVDDVKVETPVVDVPKVETPPSNIITPPEGTFDARKTMEGFATGDNDYFDKTTSHRMSDVTDVNRLNMAKTNASIAANPNMTTGSQNSALMQMTSNASANRADAQADLGKAQLEKMYGATQSLMGDDVRQEQLDYDRQTLGSEGWSSANNDLKAAVAEVMTRPELRGMSDAEIELAISGDAGVQEILSRMGRYETDAGFTPSNNLLHNTVQSTLGANVDKATTNLGGFIDDSIVLGMSQEDIMSDPKILSEAARAAGFASAYDNGVIRPEVEALLGNVFDTHSKSDTIKGAEAVVDLYGKQFGDTAYENLEESQRSVILDWVNEQQEGNGMVIENGVMTWPEGSSQGIVPWKDPNVMYGNFVTADGNNITYENGVKMYVDDNGDSFEYSELSYEADGFEDGIRAEDFDAVWDSLPMNMKDAFNKDKIIDSKEISEAMKYGVEYDVGQPATEDNPNPFYDGETLKTDSASVEDWIEYQDDGGTQSDLVLGEVNQAGGDTTVQITHTGKFEEWAPEKLLGVEGEHFFYTDDKGDMQYVNRTADSTKDMYYQASMMNGGEPMDTQEFSAFLEGGDYVWNGTTFDDKSVATENIQTTAPHEMTQSSVATFKDDPIAANLYAENNTTTIKYKSSGSNDGSRESERSEFGDVWAVDDVISTNGKVYSVVSAPENHNYQNGIQKNYGQKMLVRDAVTGEEYYIYALRDSEVAKGNAIFKGNTAQGSNVVSPYEVTNEQGTEWMAAKTRKLYDEATASKNGAE